MLDLGKKAMLDLDKKAITILQKNDRGGFTVPTARLYPFQWNWDSAFIALGHAVHDRPRAWQELETLIEGQADDGMIPSIIFRHDDDDYFPGPKVWQAGGGTSANSTINTTGISQPPVLASIVARLVRDGEAENGGVGGTGVGGDDDHDHPHDHPRARRLFPHILKSHRWWHTARVPQMLKRAGVPIPCTVHPWETGRDNCPDWHIGLDRMAVDPDLEAYQRKDTHHANPDQRPTDEEYDKYISIVKFGRDHGWDQHILTNDGPFLMADPGIFFILLRADRDLLWLAERFGLTAAAHEITAWIAAAEAGAHYLWNESFGAFCARDVRSGVFAPGFSNASGLCFYGGVGTDAQRQKTLGHMRRIAGQTRFCQASWDPNSPLFDRQRYWCGPLWCQVNYMLAMGLDECGEATWAEKMRSDLREAVELSGFYECFDPISGAGCIGRDFSWTAALWLAWASPSASEALSTEKKEARLWGQ